MAGKGWAPKGIIRFYVDHVNEIVLAPETGAPELRTWMCKEKGYTRALADNAIRGYFAPSRIVFFQGAGFRACPGLSAVLVHKAFRLYSNMFDDTPVVYNGVYKEADGETWPPILYYDDDLGWQIADGWLE